MYSPFLGLTESPFSAADRPPTVFPDQHKGELTRLVFNLQSGRGVTELIVEGSSPTLPAAQRLIDLMPDNCRCLSVFNPRLSQLGFLHALCQQLAVPLPSKEYSASTLVNLIWDELSDSKQTGDTNILVLNDAHHAPSHVFKQIAELITNGPGGEALLQTVLIGRAELRSLLALEENQAIAQQVSGHVSLPALGVADTARYIQQRMENVGWSAPLPFDGAALNQIHALAHGLPDKVDLICDAALQKAAAMKKQTVTLPILQKSLTSSKATPPAIVQGATPARDNSSPSPTPALVTDAAPPQSPKPGLLPTKRKKTKLPTLTSGLKRASGSRPRWPAGQVTTRRWFQVGGFFVLVIGLLAGVAFFASKPREASNPTEATPAQAMAASTSEALLHDAATTATTEPPALEAAPVKQAQPEPEPEPEPAETVTPPATVMGAASASPDLAELKDSPDDTWPAIGKVWGLNLGGKTACADALDQGHQCFRSVSLSVADLRSLNRPGLIKLHQNGVERWVQLLGMNDSAVFLASGKHTWQISIPRLNSLWKGAFSTLWRRPPNSENRLYAASVADPSGKWLDDRLIDLQKSGALSGTPNSAQTRLEAFQTQQNLPGDGLALPSTFIRVNQLTGVAEPKIVR